MATTDAYFDINNFDEALFDYPIITTNRPTSISVIDSELNVASVTKSELNVSTEDTSELNISTVSKNELNKSSVTSSE